MAVQKHKVTRSTRGMRRSHDSLSGVSLSQDSYSGETHRRQHVFLEQGYLRGKKVVHTPEQEHEDDDE